VSGRLTPVQRWTLGPSAIFADVNGFAVDRLGVADEGQRKDALDFLTGGSWGFETAQDLLDQADILVQHGHRAEFAQTARMTELSPAGRAEFVDLLRQMSALVKRRSAGPGSLGPAILRRLVVLRFGVAYAPLFDQLHGGGEDSFASTEMLELRSFLHSVFTDPDYADEEPRRLEMWLDPTFPREPSRYMIWDYARVMLLLRCGYMVDWLPEPFCWDRMFMLAMDVQRHYTSWQDMATCYLQGRLMWSGGSAGRQKVFERCASNLAADPNSPWNLTPWDLPLRRDWP
jgi:hypothetical protein